MNSKVETAIAQEDPITPSQKRRRQSGPQTPYSLPSNWESPDEIQDISPTILTTRNTTAEPVVVVDDIEFEEWIQLGMGLEEVTRIK